jgi:hypothetical protein
VGRRDRPLVQRLASIPDLDIATVADHEAAREFRDAESLSAGEPGHRGGAMPRYALDLNVKSIVFVNAATEEEP